MLRRCAARLRQNSNNAAKWTVPDSERAFNPHAPSRSFTHNEAAQIMPDESLSKWLTRYANDHAFEPKTVDNKSYGGDGASRKSEMREQVQHIDRRWSNPSHPHVQDHVLKGADRYEHPNGASFTNSYLEGKIVGLAVMRTDRRSLHFYEQLDAFQRANRRGFIAITLNADGIDQPALAKRHGLCHLGFRDGGKLVLRDLGITFANFPGRMPQLWIVDGSTGYVISRAGYQSVYVKPEDCMRAWATGRSAVGPLDFLKCAVLPKRNPGEDEVASPFG